MRTTPEAPSCPSLASAGTSRRRGATSSERISYPESRCCRHVNCRKSHVPPQAKAWCLGGKGGEAGRVGLWNDAYVDCSQSILVRAGVYVCTEYVCMCLTQRCGESPGCFSACNITDTSTYLLLVWRPVMSTADGALAVATGGALLSITYSSKSSIAPKRPGNWNGAAPF
jgi:hypothetical protein